VRDSDVAAAVDEVRVAVAPAPAAAATAAPFDVKAATDANVNRLTRHILLGEAAARQGIVVTQAQVDTLITQTVTGQFGGDQHRFETALATRYLVPPSQIGDFAHDVLVTQALGAKLAPGANSVVTAAKLSGFLTPLAKELGIQIAPRFGSWDYAASVLTDPTNDLSVPVSAAASPSPSPSAS